MKIFSSLDIYKKSCVRLKKGKFSDLKIFSKNPLKSFLFMLNNNMRIHIVDLNCVKNKNNCNFEIINKCVLINNLKKNSIIQLGGGLRNFKKINFFLKKINYIVISTLIFKKKSYFFKNKKIRFSIDFIKKNLFTEGWLKKDICFNKFNNFFNKKNKVLIVTDISFDGTLKGLKEENIKKIKMNFKKNNLILSGGVSSYKDINKSKRVGILGLIIGKSFYEKRIKICHIKD
ncbi:HisA/HisF-related TIM barrel protein [Candidatus Vidania fulgoroideorum]